MVMDADNCQTEGYCYKMVQLVTEGMKVGVVLVASTAPRTLFVVAPDGVRVIEAPVQMFGQLGQASTLVYPISFIFQVNKRLGTPASSMGEDVMRWGLISQILPRHCYSVTLL